MGWEAGADWVWATYRPARIMVPYAFEPPLDRQSFEAFRRAVWMRSGAPSAMCTDPGRFPLGAQDALFGPAGPGLDAACVYDVGANEIRVPGGEASWPRAGLDFGFLHAFSGPPVRYAAREDWGFRHEDGSPVLEPRTEFRGLLRVDEFGEVLSEADVPLCLQFLALTTGRTGIESDPFATSEAERHALHVRVLAGVVERREPYTLRAWLDAEALWGLEERAWGDASGVTQDEILEALGDAAELWGPDRPASRHGPGLRIPPRHWGRRDTRGWGTTWTALDGAAASHGLKTVPNAADLACFPVDGNEGTVARVRAYLREQSEVASVGDMTQHRDGTMDVWTWEAEGLFHLAASRDGAPDLGLADPLATEGFGPPDELARLRDATDAGPAFDLDRLVTEVDGMPDYAALGLLAAHDAGLSAADLCATLADVMEWPLDDRSLMVRIHGTSAPSHATRGLEAENRAVVALLRSLGGRTERRLVPLVRSRDDYGFTAADAAAARELARATVGGASLLDIAASVGRPARARAA